LNNVLNYVSGQGIFINDGTARTISDVKADSPFSGILTLAALAALVLNGGTPFSWITGPIFTNPQGAYALTNADVPNLDLSWLAIQAALSTQQCYVPAGKYLVGSKRKLPLYIPPAQETNPDIEGGVAIRGDGARISMIVAGSDFGLGVPLIACGDPSGTRANALGRYAGLAQFSGDMRDVGFFSNTSNLLPAIGAMPIAMSGLAWGARLRTQDVEASGFGKCWDFIGDHTMHIRPRAFGGTYGAYWNQPHAVLEGDICFHDFMFSGQSQASIAVHGLARILGGEFSGKTYLSAPYAILGEAGGSQDILSGCYFQSFFAEFIGNAYIADDNGFANGVYTDANKTRGIRTTTFNSFFGLFSDSHLWSSTGRGRRASFDLRQVGLQINRLITDGGQFAPTQAPSGPAPIATFNVASPFYGGVCGTQITGAISNWQAQSGSLPLFSSGTQSGNPLLTQT